MRFIDLVSARTLNSYFLLHFCVIVDDDFGDYYVRVRCTVHRQHLLKQMEVSLVSLLCASVGMLTWNEIKFSSE